MDKNSLIQDIKNDLNSIKKQVEVTLAKLAVLESMIELDNKLGISVQTSGEPVEELGVRSEELGVKEESKFVPVVELASEVVVEPIVESATIQEVVPEPIAEPEPVIEEDSEQEIVELEQVIELEIEDKERIIEEVEEESTPNSQLLTPNSDSSTPNCEARVLRNLMSIIGLNDRFRFRHDLFSDSNDLFKETIEILNTIENFENAVDYLQGKFNWNEDDATVVYFYDIIKPKF